MPSVLVASENPVKINAARIGFQKMFTDEKFQVEGYSVSSGVPDQPMSDKVTLSGAFNRAKLAKRQCPDKDFYVGMEGGVAEEEDGLVTFAWIVVMSSEGKIGRAKTGTFVLPIPVAQLVRQGLELGVADDRIFGRSNSKQANGSVGILTNNAIDRATFYSEAVVLALIPFRHPRLY